jgi:CRISPR-associated endonuclease/helicase Cas3
VYGGLLDGSWAPDSEEPVSDIGDRVAFESRRRRVLRLHERVWCWNLGRHAESFPAALAVPPRPLQTADGDDDEDAALDGWLAAVAPLDLPAWLSDVVRSLAARRQRRLVRLPAGASSPSCYGIVASSRDEATTDDEVSSFTGVEVALATHLAGVGSFARDFAERCGLPDDIVTAVEMAAQWHDIGKADARFQRMLHGGNTFKTKVASELLAKSSLCRADRKSRVRARERSGYPRGSRHELMSLALMLRNPTAVPWKPDVDPALVLYLVSSHHGYCRPLAAVANDDFPVDVQFARKGMWLSARSDHGFERLDSGVSDRFFILIERYGWFGLAWLEAILRLADHRQSEREQTQVQEMPA